MIGIVHGSQFTTFGIFGQSQNFISGHRVQCCLNGIDPVTVIVDVAFRRAAFHPSRFFRSGWNHSFSIFVVRIGRNETLLDAGFRFIILGMRMECG